MQAYHFLGLDTSKKHFIFANASFVHFGNSTTSQAVSKIHAAALSKIHGGTEMLLTQ